MNPSHYHEYHHHHQHRPFLSTNILPTEVLGMIESYLAPSDCAHLSASCVSFKRRWTALRWKRTFHLHYIPTNNKGGLNRIGSFVGCCCENHYLPAGSSTGSSSSSSTGNATSSSTLNHPHHEGGGGGGCSSSACHHNDSSIINGDEWDATKFNVSALIPSVRKAYNSLWDTIELAMLGYYDAHYNRYAINTNNNNNTNNAANDNNNVCFHRNEALSDFFDYCLFVIGLKPILRRRNTRRRNMNTLNDDNNSNSKKKHVRKFDPLLAVRSSTTSMSAWKLACILKERGVDCLRCRICDRIDLTGGPDVSHSTWMTPCNCPELVHRSCLEKQLGMVISKKTLSCFNANAAEDRMWISYDESHRLHQFVDVHPNATINGKNELVHPGARCDTCGCAYTRSVRLPYDRTEVVLTSLADPLSLLRALSTLLHFCLCVVFIGAVEGLHHDENDNDDDAKITFLDMSYPCHIKLKWPSRGGLALAWWQLQQCCMLHIFFSRRFAAMVDRLWMGPIRFFYCRLYLYFLCTSALLSVSYLPFVGRCVKRHNFLLYVWSEGTLLRYFSPFFECIKMLNLSVYFVVSTMVVCIFWRTNVRIFTVADKREVARWEWEEGRHSHPIFHGQWN